MPTPTAHVFPQFALGLADKLMDLNTDSIYVALSDAAGPITLSTSGVQAAKLWTDWKSNVAAEITGTGYTAGGVALSGVVASVIGDVLTLTAGNPEWTGASFTANQAIFYDESADTIQLIAFWDFDGAITVTAATFTLTISGSGILTATAS